MKKYLTYTALYLFLLGGIVILYLLLIYVRPDLVDAYYYRFTTPKSNSLILGGSRAAQGIKPAPFNSKLCKNNNQLINHSFALGPSSIGPNYYREIKNKLANENTNGLFILSVNPWTLTIASEGAKDDSLDFFEVKKELFVGNLKSSSTNPNFDYLSNHWVDKYSPMVNLFKNIINYHQLITLHKDGWLEVNISIDSAVNNPRIRNSTKEYQGKEEKYSETRFYFLDKIITLLASKGEVFLVRMPVSTGMKAIENNNFPDFSDRIQFYANKHNIKYIDFIDESGEFLTIDTHHLYKEESQRFSEVLCDSISNYLSGKTAFKQEMMIAEIR